MTDSDVSMPNISDSENNKNAISLSGSIEIPRLGSKKLGTLQNIKNIKFGRKPLIKQSSLMIGQNPKQLKRIGTTLNYN